MKIPIPAVVRQLALLIREVVTFRLLLFNRIMVVLLAVLLLTSIGQVYITANDDGRISGTVIGPDNEPVAAANVTMRPIGSETVGSETTISTDTDGQFVFTEQMRLLEFEISASRGDLGSSSNRRVHLYFRGQNTDVTIKIQTGSA